MGILDRMSRLIRANVSDMIDRAEDPEKMIDQILRDMESNIRTARSQVAAMIAQEKELEADLSETKQLAAEWGAKAKRAVDAGKDELAREALRRKRDNEENSRVYQEQHQTQLHTVDKLKSQLQQLESKYQATLSQRDSLIARQKRAVASRQVAEFTSVSLSPLDAGSELDRMERKIRATESEALAIGEMQDTSFDAQFAELDYDVEIEKELEALKSGSGESAGQLESGSDTESR
jgi:phage shock protein A